MLPFGDFPFQVVWTPDGSNVLVTGDLMLGCLARDTWEMTLSKNFGHKKAISCVEWLTESVFATAGADKVIKLWDYDTKSLLFFI